MKKINFGIEIGRIITMIMIMILHILLDGGILSSITLWNVKGQLVVLLEYSCIVAVNIFGMISGYVMIQSRYNFKRLITLWTQVVFFSWGSLICLYYFYNVSLKDFFVSLLPTVSGEYWYFTSYIIIFFIIPILNIGIKNLSQKNFFKLLVMLFLIFTIIGNMPFTTFYSDGGYSPIWLMYLYFVGAYMKLHGFKKHKLSYYFLLYISFTLLSLITHDIFNFAFQSLSNDYVVQKWTILRYTIPTTLFASIYLFKFFVSFQVTELLNRYILLFSKHAFSAYLLQTNVIVFNYVIKDLFISFSKLNVIFLILLVIFVAILTFAFSVLIDHLRVIIFKITHFNQFLNYIYDFIENNVLSKFIFRRKNSN